MIFDCGSRRISRGRLYMIVFCGREDFKRAPVLFFYCGARRFQEGAYIVLDCEVRRISIGHLYGF